MDPSWETKDGVDVERLADFYEPRSFDLVQCMEVLEHVPHPRIALEQLCQVAAKFVVLTSADELSHGYDEEGNFATDSLQAQFENWNPNQRYLGQPSVDDLFDLGFTVAVEETRHRQLVAWKVIDAENLGSENRGRRNFLPRVALSRLLKRKRTS
jgi:hypothetical protein